MSEVYRSAVDGFEIRPTDPARGKVAFTGERIIVEDVTTDPLWEPYRALAQHATNPIGSHRATSRLDGSPLGMRRERCLTPGG
jgi:hypothetical protein